MTGELSRVPSKRDVFVLILGVMTGRGWIVRAGYSIDQSGVTGVISAFILGGFMVTVVSLIYGELASVMPLAGGEYVYSIRVSGLAGPFARMWAMILGYISVATFKAVALPSALAYIAPGFNVFKPWTVAGQPAYGTWVTTGVIGFVVTMYLNYRGVRPAVQSQVILALVITLSGLTLLLGALFNGTLPSSPPLAGADIGGVFTIAIMTPFMSVGFDVTPQAAGEADVSPKPPSELIGLSVACAVTFYTVVVWAAGQVATGTTLVKSSFPAAMTIEITFDSMAIGRITALAGLTGILTSWNRFVFGASRAIYAMTNSHMFPEELAAIHDDHDTPSTAIVLVSGLAALVSLFGEQMFVWVVDAGGFGMVTVWLLVVVSFLVFRYHDLDFDWSSRLPTGYAVGVPGLLLTVFFAGLYLPGSPLALAWPYEWAMAGGWCLLGVALLAVVGGPPARTEAKAHLSAQQLED